MLFRRFLTIIVLSAVGIGPGFTQDNSATSPATTDEPPPAAVVNDEPIPEALVKAYSEQRRAQGGEAETPQNRESLVNELVLQQLLIEEARRRQLDQDPLLRLQIRNLLASAAVRSLMAEYQPSEEVIEAEYQRVIQNSRNQEYHARHILVDTQEEAQALIQELEKGSEFAELARAHSKDTSSEQGGDLGWFTLDVMVQPFSQALARLQQGEYTDAPVQTQFGWHVIRLDDIRQAPPPPLTEVRPRLTQQLQGQMISEYLDKQREAAEIQINTTP